MRSKRVIVVLCFLFAVVATSRAVPGDMIVYLPMDAVEGGFVKDASGSGHDGLVVGSAKSVDGKVGKAVAVGKADEIQVADDGTLDGMNAFTAELWVYMETQQATGLIEKGDVWDANMSYLIQPWSDGNIYFGIKTTASRAITKPGDFPLKQWYHLAGTFDGSTLRIFIDGKKIAEAPAPAGVKQVPDTKNPLQIGNRFEGQMDEFVFYTRALTAAEIAQDMSGDVLAVNPTGKTATTWAFIKTR
jgi:hypothetical protein